MILTVGLTVGENTLEREKKKSLLDYHQVHLQISCWFSDANAVERVKRLNGGCDNCVLIGCDCSSQQPSLLTNTSAHVSPYLEVSQFYRTMYFFIYILSLICC